MKLPVLFSFLFFLQSYAQTYMGISYNNGETENSVELSSVQRISFSTGEISFLLTDNTAVTKDLTSTQTIFLNNTPGGSPLPVELLTFTADITGQSVILRWITSNEVNNYGFEVQRSEPLLLKNVWKRVAFVRGNGNSSSRKEYEYADNLLNKPNSLLEYRLKQIDSDGNYQYSNIVKVNCIPANEYQMAQNYPNPFNPSTTIIYKIPEDGHVTITVFDILGNKISELVNNYMKAGVYNVTFTAVTGERHLASGIYYAVMKTAKGSHSIKMMLVK